MDTRRNGTGLDGMATLHVALAALGLVVVLAMLLWSAYANTLSGDGIACRARGGRMTWSGCAVPQTAPVRPDRRAAER